MKVLTTVLLLFLAGTAANALPYGSTFTDAKSGYEVAVSHIGSRMILNGRHPETRKTFRLVVSSSGQVTGTWEGKPVDYMLSSRSALKELALYRSGS